MLLLNVILPLKDEFDIEKCFLLYKEWITKSRYYKIREINYDCLSTEDFKVESEKAVFEIRRYKDENTDQFACRIEQNDKGSVWSTDCVYVNERHQKFIIIQLNCNSRNYESKLPKPHKPYIVKKFMESGFCKKDVEISISDQTFLINEDNIEMCSRVMNNEYGNIMPVVYVSLERDECWAINPDEFAEYLSGLSHVCVEGNIEVSWKLKERTAGRNAHSGYIGIYFPHNEYVQRYSIDFYNGDAKAMQNDIIDNVWKALSINIEASTYGWNQIIALQAKQKMIHWKNISENDKAELKQFVESFDSENQRLLDEKNALLKENYNLKARLDILSEQLREGKSGDFFYKKGEEKELYFSERNDLLYNILSQSKNKFDRESRGYLLIEDMLQANPFVGKCKTIVETVRKVLKKSGALTSADKAELEKCGFKIEDEGAHYKILFYNDPRYMFTVSRTPSDHRQGKNLASDILKKIDISKKI